MKRPLPSRFSFLVLLAGLLAAGCAVVTVDVDVYKGPLANTEEIQGEQVISMAMGAKPLLVQLRDHLEVGTPPKSDTLGRSSSGRVDSRSEAEASLLKFRGELFYKAGHIRAGTDGQGHQFKNELAIRVNEILGLYENAGDPSVAATLMEAETLAKEYKTQHELLEPATNEEGLRQWKRLKQSAVTNAPAELVAGYEKYFAVNRNRLGGTSNWRSETYPMDLKIGRAHV